MSEGRDFEAEARQDGWVPQEEWRGDPEKWVSAEKFVENGENINGILKQKVDRLSQEVVSLQSANKEFGEYHSKQMAKDKAERERLIQELEEARAKAVTDGDGQTYTMTDRRINELREEDRQDAPPKQELDQEAQAFLSRNAWYNSNEKLTAYADGIADRLNQQGYTGNAYFQELEKRVKDAFPEDFQNPNRDKPSSVEVGGGREASPQARTFDALPADAKQQFERYNAQFGLSKEDYVANYDWDDE